MQRAKSKADILREAQLLEELRADWLPEHAAAVTNVSTSFLRRSSCPKVLKHGHGTKGKVMVLYDPAQVRAWDAARVKERLGEVA